MVPNHFTPSVGASTGNRPAQGARCADRGPWLRIRPMADLIRTMSDERIREMHTERQQPFVRALRDALAAHSPIILHSVVLGRWENNVAIWSACVGYPGGSIETLRMTVPLEIAAFSPKTGRKFALTILAHALAMGLVPAGAEAVDKVWE